MKFLRPHRLWLALMVLAIALLAGREPLLHFAADRATADLDHVKAERAKTENDLRLLRNDVDAARQLSSQIDRAHMEQVLAPTDRLKAATMLEKTAAEARIARFAYTLAPEERITIEAGSGAQNLAQSAVNLAGDAPDDLQIYDFITQAQRQLPGRARIRQLIITRRADTPLAAANAHFEAVLDWLSNGSLQTVAGRL